MAVKTVIHLASLLPIFYTYHLAFADQLGGDPVEAILHFTGISAFNLLLLSLLVSPLAKALKQGLLIRIRRLLGLYAFFYALLHFASFILFELQLEWGLVLSEILERPYITVGFAALLILTTLAATSTQAMKRKMGPSWQKLHNWVYLAAPLIALHYLWSVKSDLVQPIIYALLVTILLLSRRDKLLKQRRKKVKNPLA